MKSTSLKRLMTLTKRYTTTRKLAKNNSRFTTSDSSVLTRLRLTITEPNTANTKRRIGPSTGVRRNRTRGSASSDKSQPAATRATSKRYASSLKGRVAGSEYTFIGMNKITQTINATSMRHAKSCFAVIVQSTISARIGASVLSG